MAFQTAASFWAKLLSPKHHQVLLLIVPGPSWGEDVANYYSPNQGQGLFIFKHVSPLFAWEVTRLSYVV